MSNEYNAVYYRNSQYDDLETATKYGAVSHWELTYGYTSTMDSFTNAIGMLSRFDSTAIKEFRFVWTIDGVTFPEMDYIESGDLLDASYDYFAKHPEILETGKQSLTLK